eukprot:860372-Lingulodinium_polyedra.AAC.1
MARRSVLASAPTGGCHPVDVAMRMCCSSVLLAASAVRLGSEWGRLQPCTPRPRPSSTSPPRRPRSSTRR